MRASARARTFNIASASQHREKFTYK